VKSPFSREFLQAVNDWQVGGDASDKYERGLRLKRLSETVPHEFRVTNAQKLYRRYKVTDTIVEQFGLKLRLTETISAWTTKRSVAELIKGGVPEKKPGVVLGVDPENGKVILNLERLYGSAEFRAAVEMYKSDIQRFDEGIGAYSDTQHEVVFEIAAVPRNSIVTWGGQSSDLKTLASKFYRKENPSLAKQKKVKRLMKKAKIQPGKRWLSDAAAVDRISERTQDVTLAKVILTAGKKAGRKSQSRRSRGKPSSQQ
jgi:hypothetical protein